MQFSREWAMASHLTFSIKPIAELLRRYIKQGMIVVDPSARDSKWATYSNDQNPSTSAQFHLDVPEFGLELQKIGVKADVILFDPPYSPRQISEHYKLIGKKCSMTDTQIDRMRAEWKDALDPILKPEGIAISFGWNTHGFGKKRGYEIIEIMLVSHGAGHNDTIVMVERKLSSVPKWLMVEKITNC